MKQRCDNPNRDDYRYYGALGITYDPKWKRFDGFYEDMREGWSSELVLDRKNGKENYTKSNCRWADRSESNFNRKVFANNKTGIAGVGVYANGYRARVGKGGAIILYQGPDFFEACCAKKSWENARA